MYGYFVSKTSAQMRESFHNETHIHNVLQQLASKDLIFYCEILIYKSDLMSILLSIH